MKILNKKEFLKMPEGTLYSLYASCYFFKLSIKGINIGNTNMAVHLCSSVYTTHPGKHTDMLKASETGLIDLPMDVNDTESHTECYEDNQLFAVWTKDDIDTLIETLITKSRLVFDIQNLKQTDWVNE